MQPLLVARVPTLSRDRKVVFPCQFSNKHDLYNGGRRDIFLKDSRSSMATIVMDLLGLEYRSRCPQARRVAGSTVTSALSREPRLKEQT